MLVRDLLPLLSDGRVVFVDSLGKLVLSCRRDECADETAILQFEVDAIEFDTWCNAFVITVNLGGD